MDSFWLALQIIGYPFCLWLGFKFGWRWFDAVTWPENTRPALQLLRTGQYARLEGLLCAILDDEEPGQVKDGIPVSIGYTAIVDEDSGRIDGRRLHSISFIDEDKKGNNGT